MKTLNTVENGLIVLGTTLGLSQFETIMGIVLLSVQLLLIITKAIITISKKVKEKRYNEALDHALETADQVQEMIEEYKKEGDK